MAYNDFSSVAAYRLALNGAIDSAMQSEILEEVITIVHDTIDENVYDYGVYLPEFHNRRQEAGGLSDKANLSPTYMSEIKTLDIEATAPWQNLGTMRSQGGVGTYGGDLSDVVEHDGMYGAPPRPFVEKAEAKLSKDSFARKLRHAIISRGF